jgi:hypothetical protein
MAKAASENAEPEESISGYFRPILMENLDLLKGRNNDELYRRWLEDHPGYTEVPERVKLNLSNIKSVLRNQLKIRKRKKGSTAGAPAVVALVAAPVTVVRPPVGKLETLEERIDDCLAFAKTVDREALGGVIDLLRQARNEVVRQLAP